MTIPTSIGNLADVLQLGSHELVSLVGGGGKTTALFELGRQLEGTVVLTTTTKMHRTQTDRYNVLYDPSDAELTSGLAAHRSLLVWHTHTGTKAVGVEPESCDRWFDIADHVVVEADGARRRPLTAPGPFEPVVPRHTTMLVAFVGADAFGRVIADQCHRPLRVAAVAGCSPYQRLTPERLANVLSSDRGLRKAKPTAARYAVVVTKVGASHQAFIDELIDALDDRASVVAIAALDR